MACYPYEIFLNQEMLEDMRCPVCSGVLREPVMDQCGHSWGRECVTAFMLKQTFCPMTNKPLVTDGSEMSICFPVKSFVNKLKIKCVNYSDCDWTNKVEMLDNHLAHECPGHNVRCLNEGCTYTSIRRNVLDHKSKCVFRPTKCPACFMALRFLELESHEEVCSERIIKCPFGCGKDIRKKNLDDHIGYECLEVDVDCPAKALGCRFNSKRRLVDEHSNSISGCGQHLNLLIMKMSEWRAEDKEDMKKINSKLNILESAIYSVGSHPVNAQTQYMNVPLKVTSKDLPITLEKPTTSNPFAPVSANTTQVPPQYPPNMHTITPAKTTQAPHVLPAKPEIQQINQQLFEDKKSLEFRLEHALKDIEKLKNDLAQQQKKANDAINLAQNFKMVQPSPMFFNPVEQPENPPDGLAFDNSSKGATMSLISPKTVCSSGVGNIVLMTAPIVPGQAYRFKIEKQSANNMAIGACIKSTIKANDYRWVFSDLHGCYLFDASGDIRRNGRFGSMIPSDSVKSQIKMGDLVELVLDGTSRTLLLHNKTTSMTSKIQLRDEEVIAELYPCVQLQEKDESVSLI